MTFTIRPKAQYENTVIFCIWTRTALVKEIWDFDLCKIMQARYSLPALQSFFYRTKNMRTHPLNKFVYVELKIDHKIVKHIFAVSKEKLVAIHFLIILLYTTKFTPRHIRCNIRSRRR